MFGLNSGRSSASVFCCYYFYLYTRRMLTPTVFSYVLLYADCHPYHYDLVQKPHAKTSLAICFW